MVDAKTDDAIEYQLELAGFRMRVLRRQFPNANDYWDGNWLVVNCECNESGARAVAQGPFVRISEIIHLTNTLDAVASGKLVSVDVPFMEPELSIKFSAGTRGEVQLCVGLKTEHFSRRHQFTFCMDLTYLPRAVGQCHSILAAYPLRGLSDV
jgi:hypothetical protein